MQNCHRGQGAIESSDASLGIELRSMSDAFCQSKMHIDCRHLAGQGATQLCCPLFRSAKKGPFFAEQKEGGTTYRTQLGQGATEYLVLLAVVLIVALVSVALLGFFPGMASDAQITQSQMYWKSAQPISIVESGAKTHAWSGTTYMYLRLKNTGAYPIRISGVVGADNGRITTFYGGASCGAPAAYVNISDYCYLGPGEEKYFAWGSGFGTACNWQIAARTGSSTSFYVGGASSLCQNSTASPGVLQFNSFGFEYMEYIDNQQIMKKQSGKALIIKCMEPK